MIENKYVCFFFFLKRTKITIKTVMLQNPNRVEQLWDTALYSTDDTSYRILSNILKNFPIWLKMTLNFPTSRNPVPEICCNLPVLIEGLVLKLGNLESIWVKLGNFSGWWNFSEDCHCFCYKLCGFYIYFTKHFMGLNAGCFGDGSQQRTNHSQGCYWIPWFKKNNESSS
jgi:hypothetical protein